MSKVSTNISIDAEIKAKAQMMLADFGLDLSTAVNKIQKDLLILKLIRTGSHRDLF